MEWTSTRHQGTVAGMLVLLVCGFALLMLVLEGWTPILLAGGFMLIATGMTIGATLYLSGEEETEKEAMLRVLSGTDEPEDARQRLEASSEALHSIGITFSNILIVLGLVASALFLLVNLNSESAREFATLVPKAFSATGYAMLCGVVLAFQAQRVSIHFRREGYQNLDGMVGLRTSDEVESINPGLLPIETRQLEVLQSLQSNLGNITELLQQTHQRLEPLSDLHTSAQSINEHNADQLAAQRAGNDILLRLELLLRDLGNIQPGVEGGGLDEGLLRQGIAIASQTRDQLAVLRQEQTEQHQQRIASSKLISQQLSDMASKQAPVMEALGKSSFGDKTLVGGVQVLARHMPDLTETQTQMNMRLDSLRRTLDLQKSTMLDKHASVLKEETLNLARVSLGELAKVADTELRGRIQGMSTQMEKQITEVYQKAAEAAADELSRALREVQSSSTTTAANLQEITNQLDSVSTGLGNLSRAMTGNAGKVNSAAEQYSRAAEQLVSQAGGLARALARLKAEEGDGALTPVLEHFTQAAESLKETGLRLGQDIRSIQEQEKRMRKVRQLLVQNLSNGSNGA